METMQYGFDVSDVRAPADEVRRRGERERAAWASFRAAAATAYMEALIRDDGPRELVVRGFGR